MKVATVLLALLASSAFAQPSTPPAATQLTGESAAPTRALKVPVMQLSSAAWRDGAPIPLKYSQAGHDVSPPLAWSHAPKGTESFVIIVHDLDVATNNGDDFWLSWMVWNIPNTKDSLPEGLGEGGEMAGGMRQISYSGPFYRGPAAPSWEPPHHQAFEIYALSSMLNVPAVMGQSPAAVRQAVQEAMSGKVLAKGVLFGTFQRP
jgi:Raf kinase inhibitor-like YbhB/YbcL family protein